MLPENKFQNLIEIRSHLKIRLDENFEFTAIAESLNLGENQLGPDVAAKVAGELGRVVGPFVYHTKRAKIDHSGLGSEKIFLRIEGAEFLQDGAPTIIVIAQVPKVTKELKVAATLRAYRYFNLASAGLRRAVKELPRVMREFFTGGAPISSEKTWDITPVLLGLSSDIQDLSL